MAKFNMEMYDKIKAVLEENKITSKDLASYTVAKQLRYMRHQNKIVCSDEEIIEVVNYERDRKTLQHGENYVEGDLDLPWEKRNTSQQ